VSNSSPLIYLAALRDFDLIRLLFGEVAIPPAVFKEVVVEGAKFPVAADVVAADGSFIHVRRPLDSSRAAEFFGVGLHAGESEALVLALELGAEALLVDDGDAVARVSGSEMTTIRSS